MNSSNTPLLADLVVPPGEASASFQPLSMMGVHLLFKAVSADSDGQWSVLEYHAPASFPGVPPHWHKVTTEAFYVIEGRFWIQIGEETVIAAAGSFITVPPGTVHTWRNPDPTPARYLVLTSPAGFEKYMQELIESQQAEPSWPPADLSKYRALGEKHDSFPPPVK